MEPRETIPVLYDFASTICYVAHRVLGRMEPELESLGVQLDWQPIDLVRITGWKRGVVVEGLRRENALRVGRELGVEPRMPAVWLDSRHAHAVALALEGDVKAAAWRERVWSAVFEEGRDIGCEDELERIAADLALDASALAGEGELRLLESRTRAAHDQGASGVPALVLNGFPIAGIHPAETMRSLFVRYLAKKRGHERDEISARKRSESK